MRERILLRIDKVEMHNSHAHIAQQITTEHWHCVYASIYAEYTAYLRYLCIAEICLNRLCTVVCQRSSATWRTGLGHAAKGDDHVGIAYTLL